MARCMDGWTNGCGVERWIIGLMARLTMDGSKDA